MPVPSSPTPGVAVVTGASSGIGAAFAERLGALGYDLLLVARRHEQLTQRAERIASASGVRVDCLAVDLADKEGLKRVQDRIAAEPNLALLVNNAGVGGIAPFIEMDETSIEQMIALNVVALTQLTRAALPRLMERRGAVINVASGAAFATLSGAAVYGATKAYVVQFTRTLQEEVGGEGVRLQALVPGLTRTNLGGVEGSDFFDRFPPEWVMSPQDVVEASLAGLKLGELVCIPAMEDLDRWARTAEALQGLGLGVSSNRIAGRYREAPRGDESPLD